MERILSFDVGLRNLAYVQLSVREGSEDPVKTMVIEKWGVVDLLDGMRVKQVPFGCMTDRVLEFLSSTFGHADASLVLIENQPCRMNPRLKSVQMVMYTYFKTMNIHTNGFPDVRLVPAACKLRGLRHLEAPVRTQSYAEKKKASILACEFYLAHVMDDVGAEADVFTLSDGKRDDLADCMLQAIAFIERRDVRLP